MNSVEYAKPMSLMACAVGPPPRRVDFGGVPCGQGAAWCWLLMPIVRRRHRVRVWS